MSQDNHRDLDDTGQSAIPLDRPPVIEPGAVTITEGALRTLARASGSADIAQTRLLQLIARHISGDWGDLEDEDKQANDHALACGGRLLSQYRMGNGRIWIITEAGHSDPQAPSMTTILTPEEY